MPIRVFDKKFGPDYLASVPMTPGVYLFLGDDGSVLYVGKAKNLRRRLGDYRRAVRGEKGYRLVMAAASLSWELCGTDLEAHLKEVELIQAKSPKQNVASAYSFLYPFLGLRREANTWWIGYSTRPETLPEFTFYGAYRSRGETLEFLSSLVELLKYVAHPEKLKNRFPPYSFGYAFRRIPEALAAELDLFLKGESDALLGSLFARLLDHAGARAHAADVKENLKVVREFFRTESEPLRRVIRLTGYGTYPVPQRERDPLFLKARFSAAAADSEGTPEVPIG